MKSKPIVTKQGVKTNYLIFENGDILSPYTGEKLRIRKNPSGYHNAILYHAGGYKFKYVI